MYLLKFELMDILPVQTLLNRLQLLTNMKLSYILGLLFEVEKLFWRKKSILVFNQ